MLGALSRREGHANISIWACIGHLWWQWKGAPTIMTGRQDGHRAWAPRDTVYSHLLVGWTIQARFDSLEQRRWERRWGSFSGVGWKGDNGRRGGARTIYESADHGLEFCLFPFLPLTYRAVLGQVRRGAQFQVRGRFGFWKYNPACCFASNFAGSE